MACLNRTYLTQEEISTDDFHRQMFEGQASITESYNRWKDLIDKEVADRKDRHPITFEKLDEE